MKTVEMLHAQDTTIILSTGHSFKFENMQPITVAECHVKELMTHGAAPIKAEHAPVTPPSKNKPVTPGDRGTRVLEAVTEVVAAGDDAKLDANGRPLVMAVSDVAGFRVMSEERDAAYATFLESQESDA